MLARASTRRRPARAVLGQYHGIPVCQHIADHDDPDKLPAVLAGVSCVLVAPYRDGAPASRTPTRPSSWCAASTRPACTRSPSSGTPPRCSSSATPRRAVAGGGRRARVRPVAADRGHRRPGGRVPGPDRACRRARLRRRDGARPARSARGRTRDRRLHPRSRRPVAAADRALRPHAAAGSRSCSPTLRRTSERRRGQVRARTISRSSARCWPTRRRASACTWVCGLAESMVSRCAASGVVGFTSGLANLRPDLALAVWEASRDGDLDALAARVAPPILPFETMRTRAGGRHNVAVREGGARARRAGRRRRAAALRCRSARPSSTSSAPSLGGVPGGTGDGRRGCRVAVRRRRRARSLADAGVRRCFTVPGESFLGLLDAIAPGAATELVAVPARVRGGVHGRGGGKLTGRPALALASRSPGACNLSIGVQTAQEDATPLVAILGQVESRAHRAPARCRRSIWRPSTRRSRRRAWAAGSAAGLHGLITRALRIVRERPARAGRSVGTGRLLGCELDRRPPDEACPISPVHDGRAARVAGAAERRRAHPVAIVGGGARGAPTSSWPSPSASASASTPPSADSTCSPTTIRNYLGHLAPRRAAGGARRGLEAPTCCCSSARVSTRSPGSTAACPCPGARCCRSAPRRCCRRAPGRRRRRRRRAWRHSRTARVPRSAAGGLPRTRPPSGAARRNPPRPAPTGSIPRGRSRPCAALSARRDRHQRRRATSRLPPSPLVVRRAAARCSARANGAMGYAVPAAVAAKLAAPDAAWSPWSATEAC